jgi:hypothetical protein
MARRATSTPNSWFLAENVHHHIKEEEKVMLPKARAAKIDFEALAETTWRTP